MAFEGLFAEPSGKRYNELEHHVADAQVSLRMGFLRKVYGIVSAQLLGTVLVSAATLASSTLQSLLLNESVLMASFIGGLVSLFVLFAIRNRAPANIITLAVFTVFQAVIISAIVTQYELPSVLLGASLTCGATVGLTLFAMQTKHDFTIMRGLAVSALFALVTVGFVQMFFPVSDTSQLVQAIFGTGLFSLFIVIDTQLIMHKRDTDEYIISAIDLYLDIVNLFLEILRIVGKKK
eukprot:m.352648 g.352648  ORF g.352648 m.352648 type:complete len:236 (-) comp16578_c0_seq1:185-892(-)